MTEETASPNMIELTTVVCANYLQHNKLAQNDLPELLNVVHSALKALGEAPAEAQTAPAEKFPPAVPIKKSITPGYLICLETGKKLKSMKRHLSALGMNPDQYRRKWGLPNDYPMVAPDYAAFRSEMAKANGLGKSTATRGRAKKG